MRDDQVDITAVLRSRIPPSQAPLSNYDHVRRLIGQAVILSGGQVSGQFTSKAFATATVNAFGLARRPTEAWCVSVLGKAEGVTRLPGTAGHYRRQTG
jgi:hypothetical protein